MDAARPDAAQRPAPPPGAQLERTALAWQRTLLGASVGCLVLAMTAVRAGVPTVAGAAALLSVYVAVRLMHRGPAHELRGGRRPASWSVLVQIVAVVAVLGTLGAAMAVVAATRGTG